MPPWKSPEWLWFSRFIQPRSAHRDWNLCLIYTAWAIDKRIWCNCLLPESLCASAKSAVVFWCSPIQVKWSITKKAIRLPWHIWPRLPICPCTVLDDIWHSKAACNRLFCYRCDVVSFHSHFDEWLWNCFCGPDDLRQWLVFPHLEISQISPIYLSSWISIVAIARGTRWKKP